MSSRALNETPWDKKEDREKDLDEEVSWGSYRIPRHLLVSGPPVESQMPLYHWPYCASISKSLSSISLIRGEGTRVGRSVGVAGQTSNCFDVIGLLVAFDIFCPLIWIIEVCQRDRQTCLSARQHVCGDGDHSLCTNKNNK